VDIPLLLLVRVKGEICDGCCRCPMSVPWLYLKH